MTKLKLLGVIAEAKGFIEAGVGGEQIAKNLEIYLDRLQTEILAENFPHDCENCKYADVHRREEPCSNCIHADEYHPYWVLKEDE